MGYYPKAIFVPLIHTQAMSTTNVSDLDTITRTTQRTALPTDVNIPQTISNLNTMAYHDFGDDTDIDTTIEWVPPITGKVDKFFLNLALLCNVTVRSGDDVTFESTTITITKGGDDVLWRQTFPTSFAIQDAAGEVRMFIIAAPIWGNSFFVRGGSPINIRIQTSTIGDTANITWEMGLVPFFPTTIDSNSKFFSQSGIIFHISEPNRETVTELGHEATI